jgi:hypothetical protein
LLDASAGDRIYSLLSGLPQFLVIRIKYKTFLPNQRFVGRHQTGISAARLDICVVMRIHVVTFWVPAHHYRVANPEDHDMGYH